MANISVDRETLEEVVTFVEADPALDYADDDLLSSIQELRDALNEPSFELGWYHVNEVWNLYTDADDPIDGTHRVLKEFHVDYINVDEKPSGDGYAVKHFGPSGELITTLTLDADDLESELRDREPTNRPHHI